ncbi:hypothetical protein SKAU_G00242720 [Synaphobranchus kaupii]|uniref:TATA box-binding protein-associated factor RNA polymerase I subunit B n=1 Tax=Synaphobranchus kaupii TaxID=118154 RepID=A0A9Q1IUI2_SYNKA|nr:hypothetical protein SKAU_G00242720 [Synaphobranchus kaupii]
MLESGQGQQSVTIQPANREPREPNKDEGKRWSRRARRVLWTEHKKWDEEHTNDYTEPCVQCSAVDWGITDEGKFYCKSCHNVIERTQEFVDSTYLANSQASRIARGVKNKKLEHGREWMVCEGFQFILKHQAEALLAMGVCPQFKDEGAVFYVEEVSAEESAGLHYKASACWEIQIDQRRYQRSPVSYPMPTILHRMLTSTLLILAMTGLHALPLPLRDDTFSPLQVHAAVPVEFRRQGTQPSRPHLVDLRSGLLQNQLSEMDRRVSDDYYVPYAVDQFRQGTQNSRTVLVDLRSGLPKECTSPPSLDGFRQGTQNSRAVLVDPRTGLMREPIGEMSRGNMWKVSRTQQVCQGNVINEKCYQFFPNAKTFNDAESSCKHLAREGHLASVTSSDLHSRLAAMVTEGSNGPVLTWLGGALQVDKFQWIDGSSWDYSDWMPEQQQGDSDGGRCLEMFRLDERWWSAADCDLQRPYICSFPLAA